MAEELPQQLAQGPIQMVYFNGFSINVGNADFSIRLRLENADIIELRGSYSTFKTLAQKLSEVVSRFEKMTDHNLMTTDEILEVMQKKLSAPKKET